MALQMMMAHQYSNVIWGHDIYKDIGEKLQLDCEDTNQFQGHAVAVMKSGEIGGHMPCAIAKLSSLPLAAATWIHV